MAQLVLLIVKECWAVSLANPFLSFQKSLAAAQTLCLILRLRDWLQAAFSLSASRCSVMNESFLHFDALLRALHCVQQSLLYCPLIQTYNPADSSSRSNEPAVLLDVAPLVLSFTSCSDQLLKHQASQLYEVSKLVGICFVRLQSIQRACLCSATCAGTCCFAR